MLSSSHPYEEPSITVILVLVGFIFLLNAVRKALDSLLYCGIVGQVLVGILFGTPGAKLLNNAVETSLSNLGYLGLILLVYEGGLSTSLSGLISSSVLSLLVALTGITIPIALSFVLLPFGASPLQCFSAGAALSATSLGTAFATLTTSGLLNTHLGTILTSAAMLDDVVGLIMLQVVAELSGGHATTSDYGRVVGRALGASIGLVVIVVAVCRLALRPLYRLIRSWVHSPKRCRIIKDVWETPYASLSVDTSLLAILVVAGSYAGISILLAAFIAGLTVRWWDDEVKESIRGIRASSPQSGVSTTATSPDFPLSGLQVYERYYAVLAERILKPFFFASIGFSIPVSRMFQASTIWKGFLYALLMFLGKLATGIWLVPGSLEPTTRSRIIFPFKGIGRRQRRTKGLQETTNGAVSKSDTNARALAEYPLSALSADPQTSSKPPPTSIVDEPLPVAADTRTDCDQLISSVLNPREAAGSPATPLPSSQPRASSPPALSRPVGPPETRALRAYAPALVGLAMTARGEIGFLIASVAESHGVFASSRVPDSTSGGDVDTTSELYLIAVWAIVLCTIIGPVAVGGLVRRVKRLEMQDRIG